MSINIRHWLGLERNVVVLLVVIAVIGMGEELWARFVPKYMASLGATSWAIAVYGTLKDFLDALYQYPGGWIADRFGRRAALVLFTVLAMVGYMIYILSPTWEWILVGTIFVMAWSSLTLPAMFAIIGDTLPQSRRAIGFGMQSILKRVPIVLAPPLGGLLIASLGLSIGLKAALAITVALGLVAIIIVLHFYKQAEVPPHGKASMREIWGNTDARLKRLLVADCLARWAEGLPKVFVVLFVIDTLRVDAFQFGWLTSIQMLTAIATYIPISKLSDRMNRKPVVLLTFVFFALFPFVLLHARNSLWLVAAFITGGLREIGEPARKALIVDLAPSKARGRAVGVYYLVRGLAVFPAPLVGGWMWSMNQHLPFISAFVIGVVGVIAYAIWGPGEKAA